MTEPAIQATGFSIVGFHRGHMLALAAGGRGFQNQLGPDALALLERDPWTATLMLDGFPVACGGIIRHWEGRGEGWVAVSQRCVGDVTIGRRLRQVALRTLEACPLRRIEALVRCDSLVSQKWARSCGFELEAPLLRAYGPDGADYQMFARVK